MKNKIVYLVVVILLVVSAYKYGVKRANTSVINQTPISEAGLCTRTTQYSNPPELIRALSLVSERWNPAPNAPKVHIKTAYT